MHVKVEEGLSGFCDHKIGRLWDSKVTQGRVDGEVHFWISSLSTLHFMIHVLVAGKIQEAAQNWSHI